MKAFFLSVLFFAAPLPAAVLYPDTTLRLEEKALFWESYGERCEGYAFPSKREEDGRCDDGDAVLFNGLLCASGLEEGCRGAYESLDAAGQWWRSPRHVGGQYRESNSFSRDMSMGAQLYLMQTRDQEAARRWLAWIEKNKEPIKIAGVKLAKVSRLCPDETKNTCLITPGIWQSMGRVWNAIGLPPTTAMEKPFKEFGEIGGLLDGLAESLDFEWEEMAALELKNAKPGYAYHLKGVIAYLAKRINESAGFELYNWQPLAEDLYRRQPENLFFRYLAEGPSEELASKLIELCPNEMTRAPKRQWAWERSDENQAWLKSMGWDCVFLANLLLERDKPFLFTIVMPEVTAGKLAKLDNQSFSEALHVMGDANVRLGKLQARCEELVTDAVSQTTRVTGLLFVPSKITVQNIRSLKLDEQTLSGQFDCHYQLDFNP